MSGNTGAAPEEPSSPGTHQFRLLFCSWQLGQKLGANSANISTLSRVTLLTRAPPLPPHCKRSSALPLFLTRHGLASLPLTACKAPGGHHAHASKQANKQTPALLLASISNEVLPRGKHAKLDHFANVLSPRQVQAVRSALPFVKEQNNRPSVLLHC